MGHHRFQDQRILVTGAASGIGLATARRLAAEGATLLSIDRDDAGLAAAGLPGTAHAFDIADEAGWDALDPGTLDGAVLNAGVADAAPIAEMDFARWRRVLSINLDGAFLSLRVAMRAMGDGGAIVLTASASGLKAEPGTAAYAASKAGVLQLARVAAREGAPRGIRVNAVAPAGVETPIWRDVPMFAELAAGIGEAAAFDRMAALATPLGHYAKAGEIAAQILFLLSDDCRSVTGSTFVCDGGYVL